MGLAWSVTVRLALLLTALLALGGCVSLWFPAPPARAESAAAPPAVDLPSARAAADPRPVVLTGDALGPLLGTDPADVVAVAWHGGQPRAVPVQVDERFRYDLATVYRGLAPGDCARASWCRDLEGHAVITGYADPGTHVGADPDPTLDALDEVALLADDFGDEPGATPPGVDPNSGVEVRIGAASAERVVTLWRRTGPRLEAPAARVAYRPAFQRGPYLATYDRGGQRPPQIGWPAGIPSGGRGGSNPEDSWVQTPHYALAFSDRWIWDRLHIGPPQARGPDLLDLDMVMFAPGVCDRTPRTGSLSEGGFLANKSGPVRAIRHAVGFNSGPLVETVWTFYPRLIESRSTLRVHGIPGVMSFLDLSDAARGAVYRDSRHPDGAAIDGRPDRLQVGPVAWQSVERSGGGWVVVHDVEASGAVASEVTVQALFQDDGRPDSPPCMTDRQWVGAHGVWARGPIPNTDPRRGTAGGLMLHRVIAVAGDAAPDASMLRAPLRPAWPLSDDERTRRRLSALSRTARCAR